MERDEPLIPTRRWRRCQRARENWWLGERERERAREREREKEREREREREGERERKRKRENIRPLSLSLSLSRPPPPPASPPLGGDGDAVKEQGGTGAWGESNRASRQHQLGIFVFLRTCPPLFLKNL
jgi:hypothetical protein